jgi:hypothetical protein
VDVDEYLHTTFDGADREFLNGEIVERSAGEIPHSRIQAEFAYLLMQMEATLRIRIMIAIRVRNSLSRRSDHPHAAQNPGVPGHRDKWIWPVDPEERKAITYSQSNPTGLLCDVLAL